MSVSFFSRVSALIPGILAVLVGTIGFSVLLRPGLDRFQEIRAELNGRQRDYQDARTRFGELSEIENRLKAISPDELKKLKAFFVEAPEVAHLLNALADRAAAAGFFIGSLEVGRARETEITGPLTDVSIQVQLKGGGYRELKQLLYLLSKTVPLLDFTSFAFQPQNALVSLNLKARAVVKADTPSAVPLDVSFFTDPNFQALSAPVDLPALEAVGRENPFAPLE
ncbi:hypothetical protein HYW17_04505 [Candidatus Uhrbacteria bacterium]|nr:hypothetical protein [Candidatus Uhrbacteria bacterium]